MKITLFNPLSPFVIYYKSVLITLALLLNSMGYAQAQSFSHPGAMHSKTDLEFIKARVAENKQPWKNAFEDLKQSKFAKLGYSYRAYSDVKCGSFNNPNVGCNNMVEDGIAAYTMALRWYIEGDNRYAAKSIEIVDAWAKKYRKNTESNARLVASWATPWYVNAAEILRYSNGSGWTEGNTNNLNAMLNRLKNHIFWEERPNNNWMMSSVEARLALAVFQNDRRAFDDAVEKWKLRIKTYIYQRADGAKPINSPGVSADQTKKIWNNRKNFNTDYIDGLSMETCRDANHMKLGFMSLMYGAEIAWTQNVDLFAIEKKRIKDFLELHGGYFTGTNIPNNICGGSIDFKGSRSGAQEAFEIAYNHLHDRLGSNLPKTLQMINNKRPTSASRWVKKWETLTFAGRKFGSSNPPNPGGGYKDLVNLPGIIQAENYYTAPTESSPGNSNRAAITKCTYHGLDVDVQDSSSDTCNVGWTAAGEKLVYRVGTAGGQFDLSLRVASTMSGKRINVEVNDDFVGSVSSAGNGWQTYSDEQISNVSIATNDTVSIIFVDGAANLDYIELTRANGPSPTPLPSPTPISTPTPTPVPTATPTPPPPTAAPTPTPGSGSTCTQVALRERKEVSLAASDCVTFASRLDDKSLAVWDSDEQACDFRGSITSVDGSGAITITSNYHKATNFSGRSIRMVSTNGCQYLKLRYY